MANFFNIDIEKIKYNGSIVSMMILNGNTIYTSRPIYEPYEFKYRSGITEADVLVTKKHPDLSDMFYGCYSLTSINTNDWNTSNVTNMRNMFYFCESLPKVDVRNFNTSIVTDMTSMFAYCSSLTELDLSSWNISEVTDMRAMFYNCSSLASIKGKLRLWHPINVTDMTSMFAYCSSLIELDLSRWDIRNVETVGNMFAYCDSLTTIGDVSNWNTSNVITMAGMFRDCNSLTELDLSGWDTSHVNNMSYMFSNCTNLRKLDLSNFSINSNTDNMFYGCTSLNELILSECSYDTINNIINSSGFPTSDIGMPRTIYCMFAEVGDLEAPENWNFHYIDGIDDSVVPDTTRYVEGEYAFNDDVIAVNTIVDKEHKNLDAMFHGCGNLLIVNNMANWDTSNVDIMRNMFNSCKRLLTLNVSNFKTDNVTNMDSMFWCCYKIKKLDVSKWNTGQVYNMSGLFGNCKELTSLDVSNWDTSNAINMDSMFTDCQSITSLDLSNFDTSMVTDMDYMFGNCFLLESLDISNFDMRNVIYTNNMFRNCYALYELRLDNCRADTISKIINSSEFPVNIIEGKVREIYCRKSEIEAAGLSAPTNWVFSYVEETSSLPEIPVIPEGVYKKGEYRDNQDITSVTTIVNTYNTDLSYMFDNCINLTSVNTPDWDTSEVTDMRNMFYCCQSFRRSNLDVSSFKTGKVTNMRNMFYHCHWLRSITGIENFDTSNVTDMYYMFYDCRELGLVTGYVKPWDGCLDLSNWVTDKVTNMSHMFDGCDNLTYLDLSNFDARNADVDYIFKDCKFLRELRLNNCDTNTINKIINSLGFPTNNNGTIYCKRANAAGLDAPGNWSFSYID